MCENLANVACNYRGVAFIEKKDILLEVNRSLRLGGVMASIESEKAKDRETEA